jgi:hypothetical protein
MKANVDFKKQIYHQYNVQNVIEFISSNGSKEVITHNIEAITTLALGSRPRQRFAKVRAKCEGQESHFMLPGVWESVRE